MRALGPNSVTSITFLSTYHAVATMLNYEIYPRNGTGSLILSWAVWVATTTMVLTSVTHQGKKTTMKILLPWLQQGNFD